MDSRSHLYSIYSEKPLGCIIDGNTRTFRVFAPRAVNAHVVFFERYDDTEGIEYVMHCYNDGVWEFATEMCNDYRYYGYRIFGNENPPEHFNSSIIIGDPYSKAVVTHNTYRHSAKTIIIDTEYDWSDDHFSIPHDHTQLIMYECHVRDISAHASSGIAQRGTYAGFVEQNKRGGLSYLKQLGINAVELLPIQEFANIEPPFSPLRDNSIPHPNTWNPYSRNHWGYMTSFYFAPESYYASDGNLEPNSYCGIHGNGVREVKDMIKALHKENIAVILDIVFNHTSHYDENPLKYCDKLYYFYCNEHGEFISTSGCGNDFRTESPMSRRLILDCIAYWLTEYNVDGFRFDLASMIDTETCKQIIEKAKSIKPNVIIIAEPWGGGKYDIERYRDLGWKAWNDLFRNAVKGQNPYNGHGFIFGQFQGMNSPSTFEALLKGSLLKDKFPFSTPAYAVNYLESHDDMTIGDFIRIASNEVHETKKINDRQLHCTLTPQQMKYNKLAALFLFISQGVIMIHQGQEFARSKVIFDEKGIVDPFIGTMDHNSYNKDNPTNHINYNDINLNKELWSYYKGLIELRKKFPHFFGNCPSEKIRVQYSEPSHRMEVFIIPDVSNESFSECLILLNASDYKQWNYDLPEGEWSCFVRYDIADSSAFEHYKGEVVVPIISGMILFR